MLSTYKFTVFIFFLCMIYEQCHSKLPDYIPVCKRDQNTINDCVRKSIEKLRPKLIDGIPELNVPSLDPFYVPEIKSSVRSFQAMGKDIKVTGAGNFSLKDVEVDLENLKFHARLRFPNLHFEGKYKMDIHFVLPIRGEGTLTADAIKCNVDAVMNIKIVEKDGVEYVEFTGLDTDISIKDYKIKLEGLFNGDKTLEDATNQALNENKAELLKAAKPFAQRAVSSIILDAANNITNTVPFDELLPIP